MNTPCFQVRACATSGTFVARRPPNRIASIGTPATDSQSSAIVGHWAAATVKREFGCAAGRPESGVQRLPGPIGELGGRGLGEALPPHVAVVAKCDVREDRVSPERLHRRRVGGLAGSGRDAEEAGLGVDRPETTVLAGAHPRDVVAEGLDAPARDSRTQHREVGLAAGGRERRRHVVGLALGRGDLDEQHVLGQPALVAAPSPRRCAARSTSWRAARCRRSPTRTTTPRGCRGTARCTSSGLHGQSASVRLKPRSSRNG